MYTRFTTDYCKFTIEKQGSSTYTKTSFPTHCGKYTEIETENFIFHFNLNGEIFRAKSKSQDWGHPHEWLKRTQGNDWVYYSTGGYTGVFEATGEYYLPNFQYPTNSILGGHPFTCSEITDVIKNWHDEIKRIKKYSIHSPVPLQDFLNDAVKNTPEKLKKRAEKLFEIIEGRISVLPPDARHVDYNLIPLTISKGCLYKCRFCKVKNNTLFTEKTTGEVQNKIGQLKEFYGDDLLNYNSIFLGEHDALQASPGLILSSINEAYSSFNFTHSYLKGSNTFLFGSVTALLGSPDWFFKELEETGGNTYINIGLESADAETLDKLGKPITPKLVSESFSRIEEINNNYPTIEITANFLMDEGLPANHYPSIEKLIRDSQTHTRPKGTIYFSPLQFDQPSRKHLFTFNRLKIMSRFPTYLYIIQRL